MENSYWYIDTYGPENSQLEGTFEAFQAELLAAAEIYLEKNPIKDQYYYDEIYNRLYFQEVLAPLQETV